MNSRQRRRAEAYRHNHKCEAAALFSWFKKINPSRRLKRSSKHPPNFRAAHLLNVILASTLNVGTIGHIDQAQRTASKGEGNE